MSRFSSAQLLEIVRVMEMSSYAAGESASQDLRSMRVVLPRFARLHDVRVDDVAARLNAWFSRVLSSRL